MMGMMMLARRGLGRVGGEAGRREGEAQRGHEEEESATLLSVAAG